MDNVKDIMIAFNEALRESNYLIMAECIVEMKKISPEFVEVMLASIRDNNDDEEEDYE